jgi:hypothetical protein
MAQQLEELGEDVPDERLIVDQQRLHGVVDPVHVATASARNALVPCMAVLSCRAIAVPHSGGVAT